MIIGGSMQESVIIELIQMARRSFEKENSAGIALSVGLHLSGEGGGDWLMRIRDQELVIEAGEADDCDSDVRLDTKDLPGLIDGSLNPMRAFLSGRIQVNGDQMALLKLPSMFNFSQSDLAEIRRLIQ
jgi:putative sterol carrier protein